MRQAALIVAAAIIALVGVERGAAAAEGGSTSVCVQVIERNDWKRPVEGSQESGSKAPAESLIDEKGESQEAEGGASDVTDASGTAAAVGGDAALSGPLMGHDSLTGPPSSVVDDEVPDRPKPWEPPPQEPAPQEAASQESAPQSYYDSVVPLYVDSNLPIGQTSVVYLERLIEHFVTHEPGFVAAKEGEQCAETIIVELYPLKRGWTAFARYSGTSREERVDQLFPSELSQFAERAVLALLHDVPLSSTINRENVLRADSQKSIQRVKGSNHFVLSLGTQLRGGYMSSVIEDGDGAGGTEERVRLYSPLKAGLGYRGRFESWGLETMLHVGIGTGKTALKKNPEGGHIDLGGDTGVGVRFLRFFDPRGLTSFYLGAGGTFELLWFQAIKPEEKRGDDPRSTLFAGGIDVDLIFGWEFMRAAAVQFYLQGELNLPAYAIRSEDSYGSIDTWFPGASLKIGVVF